VSCLLFFLSRSLSLSGARSLSHFRSLSRVLSFSTDFRLWCRVCRVWGYKNMRDENKNKGDKKKSKRHQELICCMFACNSCCVASYPMPLPS
jgi:hypothetical protein